MAAALPSGTVTFLFTDIEGSTKLLQQLGDRYAAILSEHQRLLRTCWTEHGGMEVDTAGDSFFVAFPTALTAVAAAAAATRALAEHAWPDGAAIRVRMGLHTGSPQVVGDRYVGIDVHRAARIAAAGHGGQILLSPTTRELVMHSLPEGVTLRDLGTYQQHPFLAGQPRGHTPHMTSDGSGEEAPRNPLTRFTRSTSRHAREAFAAAVSGTTHATRWS